MPSHSTGAAARHFQQELDLVDRRWQEAKDAARAHQIAQREAIAKVQEFAASASQDEIKEMARDLYWFAPDLGLGADRALGYFNSNLMRKAAGVFHTGEHCARCQQELVREANLGAYRYDVPGFEEPVCGACCSEVLTDRGYH